MKSLLLLAALVASQCNPAPVPAPQPEPEPKPLPGEFTCADACERFRVLGCEEAAPTLGGATCAQVCENAQTGPAPMQLGCIVRSESCARARLCE